MTLTNGEVSQARIEGRRDDGRCAGVKADGTECRRFANRDAALCEVHLSGPAPGRPYSGRRAGLRAEYAEFYDPDAPAVTNPVHVGGKLGGIAMAMLDVAGQKVNALESWSVYDAKGAPYVHVDMQVFLDVMTKCEKIMMTLAKLNIDERANEIEQARVLLMWATIDRVLSAAPLSVAQRSAIDAALPREMLAITQGHDPDSLDDATLLSLVEGAIRRQEGA